jgi:hypothetical protein
MRCRVFIPVLVLLASAYPAAGQSSGVPLPTPSPLSKRAEVGPDGFGWRVVGDPATGMRIGLPTELVPHAHDAPQGTRWSSAHGEIQVETFRIKRPGLTLSELFKREKHEPKSRKVMHSALDDDGFVISGMQGLKYFSVRARMRGDEIRGFTLLFDQAMQGIVAPVMGAMARAFAPFPERNAPFAVLAKPVEYGTGLLVSRRGDIVTARKVADGCHVIVVPGLGHAERIAIDRAEGLALLRVYGQDGLAALPLTTPAAAPAGDVTLIGFPDPKDQDGARKPIEIGARLSGRALDLRRPVPVAGLSGAVALDQDNSRVVGLMETRNAILASAGPAPAPVRLIPAATIHAFLAAHAVPMIAASDATAHDAMVQVICVRK